jgi:hypothetical protein
VNGPEKARGSRGAAVLVTSVGGAAGSRAAAAALACAGAERGEPGLLVELGEVKQPRASLFATEEARRLEERLASHLPDAAVASRGGICLLALPAGEAGLEQLPAALAIGRDALSVVHPGRTGFRRVLDGIETRPQAVLLRADLAADRALTGLAAGELLRRGLRVAVLKRPLNWLTARLVLAGSVAGRPSLTPRVTARLLGEGESR